MTELKEILLNDMYEEFMTYCRVRNLTKNTLVYYRDYFKPFAEFYGNNMVSEIDKKTITKYLLWLKDNRNINDITTNTHLRCLGVIINYCAEEKYIEPIKVKLIKAEKRIKETYTDNEIELLIKKPDLNKCDYTEYRNWVMVNYFLSTGNRMQTVANLKVKDIDFLNMNIILERTKNRRQQTIPLNSTLASILKEYLSYKDANEDDYIFSSKDGEPLLKSGIVTAIKRYNKNRGVNKVSVHLFRHTFAKKWILGGGDMFRLQKLLGHSTLDMVRNYVEMFSDDLKRDYEILNPLEQVINAKKEQKRNKLINTSLERYGTEHMSQNSEVKQKIIEAFAKAGSVATSKQQIYLHNLLGGELNYPVEGYPLDIAFPDDMIYIEYNGGGHNLSVKMGKITASEFKKREENRKKYLQRKGWRLITIESIDDNLPSDVKILELIDIAKDHFVNGGMRFEINIDERKIKGEGFNKKYVMGVYRKIKKQEA